MAAKQTIYCIKQTNKEEDTTITQSTYFTDFMDAVNNARLQCQSNEFIEKVHDDPEDQCAFFHTNGNYDFSVWPRTLVHGKQMIG